MGLTTKARVQDRIGWMLVLTLPACNYWEKGPPLDPVVKFYESFDNIRKSTVLPEGWRAAKTNGDGTPVRWDYDVAGNDDSDMAIRLTGPHGTVDTFTLCLYEKVQWTNVNIYVDVGPRFGGSSRGGGIAWRVVDDRNYYAADWNPLENKVRGFKIVKGVKEPLGAGDVTPMETDRFRILRVQAAGSKHRVALDGVNIVEFVDDTFASPGLIGLWSTGDALTAFNNFVAVSIP